jgi:hypothetical protein
MKSFDTGTLGQIKKIATPEEIAELSTAVKEINRGHRLWLLSFLAALIQRLHQRAEAPRENHPKEG